jgi:Carboxypeptidase regulatory-like domain
MRFVLRGSVFVALGLILFVTVASAQLGNSGSIEGVVKDPSGAAIVNATVEIKDPVSGYLRTTNTNSEGAFRFTNVPFNPYHLTVNADGFAPFAQDVQVRSSVPATVEVALKIGTEATKVVVESGGDLLENDPTFHSDLDRNSFARLPLESPSSSVSSLVTLTTPGIAADSNGLFHGLGDHAENSFSVDGQPITDQQSKVFSNQIPSSSIQSLEVISGAPPAEFGDKTSLVIKVTTRSGQGVTTPHGSATVSYGSFGSATGAFDLAYGGPKWGNFIAVDGLNTGRFLDPPEFSVMHAKGNLEDVFDRIDYQFSDADTVHLNLGFTRSWFQNPNSYDNLNIGVTGGPDNTPVGPTDQRSKIQTYNIAPTWTRLINPSLVFTLGGFVRHDGYNYYPSENPFADLGPLQSETVAQNRSLTNAGALTYLSYAKGIHNVKAGITYEQTFLTENDHFGVVNPTLNSPCLDAFGNPVPGFTSQTQCTGALQPNPNTPNNPNATAPYFFPVLVPYDLTRGGTSYLFHGHTDVKELALYVQDSITFHNWAFNVGIRGDLYNGISIARQPEPRLGAAYNIKKTSTILRTSYARIMETPFNENLVIASTGCGDPVVNAIATGSQGYPCLTTPLKPSWRNEFHAGFQQAFGKYLVVDAEYIWKYTHYGYDFSIFGNTPIFFPVEWHNSKIPGYAIRATVPEFHGFTALVVMSSVAARFFQPQMSGIGVTPAGQGGTGVFRIDHDEKFNQTTHLQYQPWKTGPWVGFNWRYDSGLVAGAVPFGDGINPVDVSGLTPDQQFQAGLACGGVYATPTTPISSSLGVNLCPGSQYSSKYLKIPAPGTENDDHNPPRIAPRNLFDLAVGHDNLFHGDRYRWSARFTVINVTDKIALYNFLSTFSGTHYVTPRTFTGEIGFHF